MTIKQQRYKETKQAKRIAFDLYLTDDKEAELFQKLDKAKAEKQLKTVILQALTEYFENNQNNV